MIKMGAEIGKRTQCPACAAKGLDKSKNNLATYDDGKFCQACGYTDKKSYTALIPGDIIELADRGISLACCEKYNVRTVAYKGFLSGHELNNEPLVIFPIYENGRVVKQKLRSKNNKDIMSQLGKTESMRLFGQNTFSPNKQIPIIVTEGEYDALSMYQMSGLPTVSIVRGVGGAYKELLDNLEWLSGFKEVLLCFDMDESGRSGIEKCIPLFEPGTVRNITLPLKDANEMLLAGRQDEIKKLIWNAEVVKPKTIIFPNELREEVLTKPKYGTPWPWDFMTKVTYGNRLGEVYMLAADTSIGKEQPVSALVSTPSGFKTMGGIQVGDKVNGYRGVATVTGVFPQGVKPVYKLTFSDGRSCEAGLEHLWEVKTHDQLYRSRRDGKNAFTVMTTKDLINYKGVKGLFIKTCKPVEYITRDYVIPPYSLGVLIGDGALTGAGLVISSNEEDIITKVCSELHVTSTSSQHNSDHRLLTASSRHYREYLVKAGLTVKSPCRFIPHEYLYGSIQHRQELLKGLMDTDGHVSTIGAYSFSTTSAQLKDDFVLLCRGLGYIVTTQEDRREKYTTGVCYKVSIKTKEIIVSSEKHLARLQTARSVSRNRSYYHDHLKLVSVEYVREEESKCIMLDSEDHLYLTNDYVVTHNTEFMYQIISHHIRAGCKVGLIDLERQNTQTLQRVIAGMINKRIYLPDCDDFNEQEIAEQLDKLQESLVLYRPESGKLSVDSILINIRYLAKAYKTNFFVIDNLTALSTNIAAGNKDYEVASQTVGQLVQVAKELNVTIFIVNHLVKDAISLNADITMPDGHEYNASKEGLTWETGRVPGVGHIYGGGKVAKLPDYLIVLARNRMSTDKDIQRTLTVKFLKTRMESSHEGEEFKLQYDYATGQLIEKRW